VITLGYRYRYLALSDWNYNELISDELKDEEIAHAE
jgi:hypothetical protein